jgi:hypothetical protein
MLAVTIKRRGTASRAGWEDIGGFGLDKILIRNTAPITIRAEKEQKQKGAQVERPTILFYCRFLL